MSATDTQPAAARPPRAWYTAQAALLALIICAACVLLGVLASRTSRTWDLTATRTHRLSAQTLSLLARVAEPIELVVAAPLAESDPTAAARSAEVMSTLAASQPRLRVTTIDTASADGATRFAQVLSRLRERNAAQIARSSDAVRAGLADGRALGDEFAKIAPALDAIAAATIGDSGDESERLRKYWSSQAIAARKLGEDTLGRVVAGEKAMASTLAPLDVPPLDDAAASALEPLAGASASLAVLSKALDDFLRLPAATAPPLAKDRAKALSAGLTVLRDSTARRQNELAALPKLPLIQVARAIQRNRAALIIGDPASRPPGDTRPAVLALDIDQLLPPARAGQDAVARAGGVDTRFRTEELIAGALTAMVSTDRPMVVLVHGAAKRMAPDFASFRRLADRLDLANIELAEWAAGLDEPPPVPVKPASGAADDTAPGRGKPRPVIWATIGLETGSPESAVRMGKLSAAISQLVVAGQPMLLSMNPSNLPNLGAPDPMAEALRPLGIVAQTGRVVLEQAATAAGDPGAGSRSPRSVYTDQYLQDPRSDHAIAATVTGIQTRLPWVVPVSADPSGASSARVWPLIVLAPTADRWTDEEWLTLRQTMPGERDKLPNLPSPTGPRAAHLPAAGLPVAVAVERTGGDLPSGVAPQRAVVVGSNGWFFDGVVKHSNVIDGRVVFDAPGNLQLFESCVWWLAGRNDRLGRGAASQTAAIIPDLTPGQLSALRWVLIAAMPAGVLLLGALYRFTRG